MNRTRTLAARLAPALAVVATYLFCALPAAAADVVTGASAFTNTMNLIGLGSAAGFFVLGLILILVGCSFGMAKLASSGRVVAGLAAMLAIAVTTLLPFIQNSIARLTS